MHRAWMLALLAGCTGSPQMLDVSVTIQDPPFDPICMATASWVPPTERIDDTPITFEELDRFDLYIGLESGVWYRIVGIEDVYLIQWSEDHLLGGDNFFTMTVTDTDGLESEHSNEVVKFIDARCAQGE